MKSIYLCSSTENLNRVYSEENRARIAQMTEVLGTISTEEMLDSPIARQAEIAFSTWGMFSLTKEQIEMYLPNMKAVFYGAGTVQYFAKPFLEKDIRVFSAWQANAVPVAEYTYAQILLSLKGYFQVEPLTRYSRKAGVERFHEYTGIYAAKIGLIGCGAVGTKVAQLLQNSDLDVYVCDPYLPDEKAKALHVTKCDMDTLFAECDVISNHLPNLPATVGLIKREHLLSMKPYATFINTGRGPQLDEGDLYDALKEIPTRTALLDVMTDEQNSVDSPLNTLPNCRITPHIAGSAGQEVWRMSKYMADECERMLNGQKCLYEVTKEMLKTMA